jgi:hypothetical protein
MMGKSVFFSEGTAGQMKSAPSFAKDDDSTLPKEPNGSKIGLGPKPIWGMSGRIGREHDFARLETRLIDQGGKERRKAAYEVRRRPALRGNGFQLGERRDHDDRAINFVESMLDGLVQFVPVFQREPGVFKRIIVDDPAVRRGKPERVLGAHHG